MDFYAEYSTLIDTALVIGLALTVWVAYRELRNRRRTEEQHAHATHSPAA
jgi:hypothetical protein